MSGTELAETLLNKWGIIVVLSLLAGIGFTAFMIWLVNGFKGDKGKGDKE
jgi:hypothetical protein